MRRRSLVVSLFGIIGVAFVALAATLLAGRAPLLGLDLRGGASVVLQPQGKVNADVLTQAISIINRRINGLGVANSTVVRQGNDVVIEVPGAENAQTLLKTVGTTAQLYLRPVYCTVPAYAPPPSHKAKASTSSSSAGAATHAQLTADVVTAASTNPSGAETRTTVTGAKVHDSTAYLENLCSAGSVPTSKKLPSASAVPSTTPDADLQNNTVILPVSPSAGMGDVRMVLGPADATGTIIKTASAVYTNGQYQVDLTLTSSGLKVFNEIAAARYPNGQSDAGTEAYDLDGLVESAPYFETSTFTSSGVTISASSTNPFTATTASDLATELRYGSLPVRFNAGSISTISATLGHSDLVDGLLAGIGGILLVLIYMIAYYRTLGLVVLLGLFVGGALLYSILTELSYAASLALTLEGITGIIVSVGITVDSYVVYFERLKDEIRSGKTVRASVERGFARAFRTVLTADLVSFMAALILYLFTVGDVRGFAFTLGLSTLLDVFTAYFFIRPIVILLGRRRAATAGGFLGMARGLGVTMAEAR